ncbi:hypothetical protein CLOP_g7957 [Closterium sp. NIES-67]|nr:hypothetical protein CLOP_g7957 [Closterium sp. NIES-67]
MAGDDSRRMEESPNVAGAAADGVPAALGAKARATAGAEAERLADKPRGEEQGGMNPGAERGAERGAEKPRGEERRQRLWEMYGRMQSKLFQDVPEMGVTELHQLLLAQQARGGEGDARGGRQVVVVDTRTEEETAVSMIPGGTLKQRDFERQIEKFNDHRVVCYCTIGYRSGNYARMLRSQHQMDAYNLKGSILSWTHHHLPLTSLYHPTTGSGPLTTHANTATAPDVTPPSSHGRGAAPSDAESRHENGRAVAAEEDGRATVGSPVLPLGATARVHVYSPKYELHADGYQPVHFANGVPWVSAVWSDISMRLPKWVRSLTNPTNQ